jgi:hypothetical protein
VIAGAVVLGWQVALQPFLQRAPVEAAIQLGPTSPEVLRRAAEAELAAGRSDNAAALGRDALARSPFDVRALRVVGLTEARAGRDDQADEILTLAGNWSLRDDPTHAWLVERRLQRGDYASSFAHADTLVRRRADIRPQVFRLFTLASAEDPQRALPVVASLLAADPPWRGPYLQSLNGESQGLQVAVNLAILLQASRTPFSNDELQPLYRTLSDAGAIDAVRTVRERLNRPPGSLHVTNGGFDAPGAPQPFQWWFGQEAGVVSEIVGDDLHPDDPALRVDYDGYATVRVAEQLMLLPAGSYRLAAQVKVEAGDPASRLVWTLICHPGQQPIAVFPAAPSEVEQNVWTPLSQSFAVPANCPSQWLRLDTRPGDRRSTTVAWFDRIAISPED